MEKPPNDHDLSTALGEDVVVVSGRGVCHAASQLSNVVVGLKEPRSLRDPVSARALYCKRA